MEHQSPSVLPHGELTAAAAGPSTASNGRVRRVLRLPFRLLRVAWQSLCRALYELACAIPYFRFVRESRQSQSPRNFSYWFMQKVIGFNRGAYWPVHFTSRVNQWQNVLVGVDTSPGYEPGCYIQGLGRVYIGDYTEIAQNVGIISANHDPRDHSCHDTSRVLRIGSYCWIGMGAIILPGVELGDFTVVGAGSVVTKPFPEGYAVIAGNPARLVKRLEPDRCVRYKLDHEYRGFIPAERFDHWKKFRLWV